MHRKFADTHVPIHDLLARRWSGRAFDRGRPVSREQLTALLEAARWAPSCYGDEPWRFIVWDRFRDETAWQKAFECLGEWNRKWARTAPVLLLSAADSVFTKNGKPNRWGQHDTGAAGENLQLQAAALGLMAHPMGGFDADKARREFGVPERFTPMAMIAVGHPAPAETLEGEYRDAEIAARGRTPLGTRFFEGGWDIPFDAR
jgi:nitroreductase